MVNNTIQTDYRNLVVGVDARVPLSNGTYTTAVNFDNAATTPPFYSVLQEINRFSPWYSSVHRGKGYKSMLSSEIYENGRKIIKDFVNADEDRDIVVYTKNATEAINMLAFVLSQNKNGKNVVLSTWMEHAANDLPWRDKFDVDYIEVDKFGKLSLENLKAKLSRYGEKVKLVTVTGASNVTGYINPIYEIAKLAHRHGAKILVDSAQLAPHARIDMKPFDSPEHIDFVAFSAHKMYAPYGIGVMVGPREAFEKGLPYVEGGGAIKLVTHKRIQWEGPPDRDEAGSPNVMGVAALSAAIKALKSIGMDNAYEHEKALLDYAVEKMTQIPGVKIYSQHNKDEKSIGVIPFNIDGVHHQIVSAILSFEAGIAVRNGFFCSHPYCERLLGLTAKDMDYYFENPDALKPGLVRVSFGIYNNYSEIDRLIYALNTIVMNKSYYVYKYTNTHLAKRLSNDV